MRGTHSETQDNPCHETISQEFATFTRKTKSSAHCEMPSTALGRGDLVAAEFGVEQRGQSRPASMRKCPPVDHFGPRRGGGPAAARPRIRGARAHSTQSARRPI